MQGFGEKARTKDLGRPRRGWKDNIKMDLREQHGVVWNGLDQNRDRWGGFLNMTMNLRVTKRVGTVLRS
jgi:hypothetical protein